MLSFMLGFVKYTFYETFKYKLCFLYDMNNIIKMKSEAKKMERELEIKLIKEMKKYGADEFKLYCAEAGWEDWMNNHITSEEDTILSEQESKLLEKIQKELWEKAHGDSE